MEAWGNNRSVMPLDVVGCTRATLMHASSRLTFPEEDGKSFKLQRDGDRLLKLSILNEEFLVSAFHQLALIASLPFVHTARRSYRLSGPANYLEINAVQSSAPLTSKLREPYHLEEGEVVTRFP